MEHAHYIALAYGFSFAVLAALVAQSLLAARRAGKDAG